MVKSLSDEATKKRLRAGRLLLKGKRPAEVAFEVGAARQTVYTWKALLDEGGIEALRSVPSRGRPARLDESQLEGLRRAILQKPTEHGFGTELWTLKRVGVLIERLYDVKFGQTQIWRILGALGFSVQKPEKRAIERDEDAVRSGNAVPGPLSRKSPSRRPTDRLCRRVRHQRALHARAHLGAQGSDARHPVSLQLESRLGDCRTHAHQLFVQAARGQHPQGRDRRISQSTQGPSQATSAGNLGWFEGASQPLGARLSRCTERAHPNRLSSSLCPGPQSGRISVGVAQATWAGQLLS